MTKLSEVRERHEADNALCVKRGMTTPTHNHRAFLLSKLDEALESLKPFAKIGEPTIRDVARAAALVEELNG